MVFKKRPVSGGGGQYKIITIKSITNMAECIMTPAFAASVDTDGDWMGADADFTR